MRCLAEGVIPTLGFLIFRISLAMSASSESKSSQSSHSSESNGVSYSGYQDECSKELMCYFTNWATYRPHGWAYTIDNLQANLCSYYIYAFALLDGKTYKIVPAEPDLDIKKEYYKKFCKNVKAAGNKPILAVGGWNDSKGTKWEELLKDPKKQDVFIKSAVEILRAHGFMGLELDYEYPGCPQGEFIDPKSKKRFTSFVKRIDEVFKDEDLAIAIAIPADSKKLTYCYELKELDKNIDWFNVMGYDYHGTDEGKTYLHAPFKAQPSAPETLNVEYTIDFILEQGVDPMNVILGIPLYGKGNTLADPTKHTINSPTTGPSLEGKMTKAKGTLAFFEICLRKKNGWKVETKYQQKYYGRWIYKDDQWIGYDDKPELRRKVALIENRGLGGGMIWALDFDDFRDRCKRGVSPLVTYLSNELLGNCRMNEMSSEEATVNVA